jgi:hypothetical protein
LILAQATLAAPSDAASIERRFTDAQSRFEAAQAKMSEAGADALDARRAFRESAESFAALARDGVTSANLCVNAGNAYHFAGDEPRALLWYLRAARLANTPEIRAGLVTLRHVCKAEPWPPPRPSVGRVLMSWHYDLGRRLKQILLLALYPTGTVLIIVGLFARRRRPWLRAGLALMIVGGIMGVSDAVAASAGGEDWAVVLEPAKGLSGDGQMYSTVVDTIPPGQEVRLIETRPAWLQVELPNGARCWLQAGQCEPVSTRQMSS